MPFSLFLALKYLRPKRSFISVVTVISIVGVLLGVAILVIVQAVMTGFDGMWREKILDFKPHITITASGGPLEGEEDVCKLVESVPGVTGVAPSIETRVLMRSGDRMNAPVAIGVLPARAGSVSKIPSRIVSGKFDLDGDKVVIGIDIAYQMGIRTGSKVLVYSPMSLGSKDEMYLPEELVVSGIFDMGMRDFDGGFILTSLDVARDLVGMESGVHSIQVMTTDPYTVYDTVDGIGAKIGSDYNVATWQEVDRMLFDVLRYEKNMMFVLLVFITVVAIFCVTNTLIVITVQKTNEIGLLKALGFSSWKIMGAFVWHGWIQCMAGIGSGIGVGLLVLHNLKRIVKWLTFFDVKVFPKEIYGLSEIPWAISWGEITQIAVLVMVFCTLASFIPAYRAARMDPVEALRHE